MTTYYKVLDYNRMPYYGGQGQWPYRKWLEVEGPLVPCRNGLHVCTIDQLRYWLGPTIWQVEVDESELLDVGDKTVVRRARLVRQVKAWNKRSARLLACDFAERVLPIFEAARPGDDRPRRAIEAARAFANGTGTQEQMDRAAEAAEAAWAAEAAKTAWAAEAAWAAARAVKAAGAARAAKAAWAAEAAERKWQVGKLRELLEGERG